MESEEGHGVGRAGGMKGLYPSNMRGRRGSMQAHVKDPLKPPLLIFPEGTCVNNEYCVMFKRGAFDLGATVHPSLPSLN